MQIYLLFRAYVLRMKLKREAYLCGGREDFLYFRWLRATRSLHLRLTYLHAHLYE